jgi:ABC-type sugar transport system substrate-binding protein
MTASYTTKVLEGKGNVVYVEAIAGSSVDAPAETAWNQIINSCPGMKASKDKIYAGFAQATAKQEMLKYLGTHPQKVDAVFETQVMDTGVMQAFAQSSRPMPVVPSNGLTKGAVGYWREHQSDGYYNSGQTILPVGAARATVEVALRVLDGQGVKLNNLVAEPFFVTDAGLSDLTEPDWNLNTPGSVGGPEQGFMPSKYIDDFFNHPKPVK